ncbi:ABC transporter ATP-binding protein [Saccharophagus degradans]|uniref:ABC transporter ATP-binding protein n=1 Tax=Saccharophagus degradans TaxID=86304 RepID=A0AAW7XAW9_9GAMM|nr:ABC transporter ATP-binding protein [Saccharophagus degradans]MBU2986638.1 ABC transporter ATP-binding protein [Saccharophagus degradans]MDO6424750.1 ABC transporter ATP-binding protein [Saccharophagus degradans]MDO6609498.1 ABC transporter ATP-binding protein [Saccharophagus degradans]
MIEVNSIFKSFRDNQVLHNLSFSVPKGHITGLVGPNGSGKSTTIRILTGFSDADSGEVTVDGRPMSVNAVESKRLVGYAPENAPSYREQTVIEYLQFIARLRGVEKKALPIEVERVITAFSLNKVANQAIGTLSKGYRHRVSLAQCILGDPPVIVLDEPTDGLDPIQKISTRRMILELAESKAVLLTTHLLEEVKMLCDRVVAIRQGRVVYNGKMQDLHEHKSKACAISLTVAGNNESALQQALTGLDGVASLSVSTNINMTHASFTLSGVINADIDYMNAVSLRLQHYALRIVELRRDDSPLEKLFESYSELHES